MGSRMSYNTKDCFQIVLLHEETLAMMVLPGHLGDLLSHLHLGQKVVPLLLAALIYKQLPICHLCILHIPFLGYEEED